MRKVILILAAAIGLLLNAEHSDACRWRIRRDRTGRTRDGGTSQQGVEVADNTPASRVRSAGGKPPAADAKKTGDGDGKGTVKASPSPLGANLLQPFRERYEPINFDRLEQLVDGGAQLKSAVPVAGNLIADQSQDHGRYEPINFDGLEQLVSQGRKLNNPSVTTAGLPKLGR